MKCRCECLHVPPKIQIHSLMKPFFCLHLGSYLETTSGKKFDTSLPPQQNNQGRIQRQTKSHKTRHAVKYGIFLLQIISPSLTPTICLSERDTSSISLPTFHNPKRVSIKYPHKKLKVNIKRPTLPFVYLSPAGSLFSLSFDFSQLIPCHPSLASFPNYHQRQSIHILMSVCPGYHVFPYPCNGRKECMP